MLDADRLRARLPIWGLGQELHYHLRLGSTNDEAAQLARQGAPEGTLVVAEAQTAGRGRAGRAWFTPPGSSLALSLVLRPGRLASDGVGGLSVMGALAVAEAAEAAGAPAEIKWPNDVLLGGHKTAGVLVEGSWMGSELEFVVCGIGVNVGAASVPPMEATDFPATCVEAAVGRPVDRQRLLLAILDSLGRWYPRLGSPSLHEAWERRLAYRGREVSLIDEVDGSVIRGHMEGLTADGRMRLRTREGTIIQVGSEGRNLRPLGAASPALAGG